MKITEEKGITLITLVTTIVLIIILASVGITTGTNTLETSKFSQFKNELKVIHAKVNEISQGNQTNIGKELTQEQKDILNKTEVSNIIYAQKTEEEIEKIQNGFRYIDTNTFEKEMNLEGIKRAYLINFEYGNVVSCKGVEYNGKIYYMANQIEGYIYNVQYDNKNSENTCTFSIETKKEGNKWKIEVSDIIYDGYINNWKVKYRTENETYWTTANNLSFYVTKPGNYYVKVEYENSITSEPQLVSLIDEE